MQNRRQFINTVIRGGIFSTLTLLSGVLIHRWSNSDDCSENFACSHCKLSNGCQLPEADKYRLDKARLLKTNAEDGRPGK